MKTPTRKTVTVVGVGALGSHLLQFLRSEDVFLRAIDADHIEKKNTLSQFHGATHIGKFKTQSIAQTMDLLWGAKVRVFPVRLVRTNILELVGSNDADLVVDCLDNGESRLLLQEHAQKYRLPLLHGALAADGAYAGVVWDKDFRVDFEKPGAAATCEGGEHLPFIALTAAHLAHAAQVWIRSGKQVGYSISPAGVNVI